MSRTVLDYLETTVPHFADKPIFDDTQRSITFGELRRAAQAIGTAVSKSIQPGQPVLVMSGRHVLTPACYLGVVYAGGFYAPMDASMPAQRLNQMIHVLPASLMLVDQEHLAIAQGLDFSGRILVMEEALTCEPDEAALEQASGQLTDQSPLYVIFTSGSSGTPKGVITSHHSLMCYIEAVRKVLRLTSEDVLGNQSPLDYIAAIRDIYLPLAVGASTVILPKNQFAIPSALFETLNRYQVTTLCWSVPGLIIPAKLKALAGKPLETVNKVLFSGSVMPCGYLRAWQDALPDARFINQYGPTEATASCTYYEVPGPVSPEDVLPIGKPYENYRVFLLNEDNTPTPAGEMGEICVAGPCLALGYYGDAKRTAEAFMQNPLNPNYRELIYKTGDLGLLRADGMLEFHGRKDRQIKHLGHRIELSEIEETARRVEGVTDCCALYNKEKELLTLFYTGTAQSKEIVLYFRGALPGFMAPRKLNHLEELPCLPNGKIDMQTLKAML